MNNLEEINKGLKLYVTFRLIETKIDNYLYICDNYDIISESTKNLKINEPFLIQKLKEEYYLKLDINENIIRKVGSGIAKAAKFVGRTVGGAFKRFKDKIYQLKQKKKELLLKRSKEEDVEKKKEFNILISKNDDLMADFDRKMKAINNQQNLVKKENSATVKKNSDDLINKNNSMMSDHDKKMKAIDRQQNLVKKANARS